jgi:hypothetical protein
MMSGISAASGPMFSMRPDPREMFNRIDKDGSGGIDADELSALTEKMAERSGEAIDADKLMETYDSDGDGVLNEEETHSAMESLREEMGPPPGGGRPPMGGPMANEGMGFMDGRGLYLEENDGGQSLIDQMLTSLPELTEDEDAMEVIQQWLQTLKGENPSYSPLDTLA